MRPRAVAPPFVAALLLAVFAALAVGGCNDAGPVAPAPPPLQPFLPELRRLVATAEAAALPTAAPLAQYADLALQVEAADDRLAARAERLLLEDAGAIAALAPALRHADAAVRSRAAWLLGRTGRAIAAFPLLLRQKDEVDGEVQLWIADALHRVGNDSGLAVVDAAMASAPQAERAGRLAIDLLTDLGNPPGDEPTYVLLQQSLRALTSQWLDTGIGSRKAAIAADPAAVAAIVAAHLAATEGTALRPVDEARHVLTRSGTLALPLLERALAAAEPYLRTMALQVLTDLGPAAHSSARAILTLLDDPLTAAYAIRALGAVQARDAVPLLRTRLAVADTEQRAAAAHALGLLNDTASAGAFDRLLADERQPLDVRVQVAFARRCLGADAAAAAFLDARLRLGDYHPPTLQRLMERLERRR